MLTKLECSLVESGVHLIVETDSTDYIKEVLENEGHKTQRETDGSFRGNGSGLA